MALALGVSRLACFADCGEPLFLLNVVGYAIELVLLAVCRELRTNHLFVSLHVVSFVVNFEVVSLAKDSPSSCNLSSFNGV